MAISDKPKDIPADYNETKEGRFLARLMKDKNGMYKDEIREYKDGRKTLVRFPYTKRRAEKYNFREMTIDEIAIYHKIIHGEKAKPTYGMLERELDGIKEKERLREEDIKRRKVELLAREKAEEIKKAQTLAMAQKVKAEAPKPPAKK